MFGKTVAFLVGLPVLGLASLVLAGEPAAAPAPDGAAPAAGGKPELAASVLRLSGDVQFRRAGKTEFQALDVRTELFTEDWLRTGPRSVVELKLLDDSLLTLGAESSMVIRAVRSQAKPDDTLLDLEGGLLGVTVNRPLAGRQRFEVSTPVAVCGVRGTRFVTLHERPRRGAGRGRTQATVGIGALNVRCLNPLFAGQPGMRLGRNQSTWVTWDGFAGGQPQPAGKRALRQLMGGLPGWVPDPADPTLIRPLQHGGGDGGGADAAGERAGRVLGAAATGAYEEGPGGFRGATGRAILGRLGMGGGSPMSRMLGAQPGAGGSEPGSQDPVDPVMVRPGQPTQLEVTPEPVEPPIDDIINDNINNDTGGT